MGVGLSVSKPDFLVRDVHAPEIATSLDQCPLWPAIFIYELAAECDLSIKYFFFIWILIHIEINSYLLKHNVPLGLTKSGI